MKTEQQLAEPLTTPPLAVSWQHVVDSLAHERGGLAALSRYILDVAPPSAGLSEDPMTVERGLRRLRKHEHQEANKYGRLILRVLGVPESIARWARELGQYHSRSSDLPTLRRRDQLRLWNCPPISESTTAIWVFVGLATVSHRLRDGEQRDHFLELARLLARGASPEARAELLLFEAVVLGDRGDDPAAVLQQAEEEVLSITSPHERASYLARLRDQQAYRQSRGWRAEPARLQLALRTYESIPNESGTAFATFRREHGRAWCLWRLGRTEEALAAVRKASEHAGDGGFVRFRVMSLKLESEILGDAAEASDLRQRIERMLTRLGDLHLSDRMGEQETPDSPTK